MHECYNPALSPQELRALDWENQALVQAAYALLGGIPPSVRAVFVEAEGRSITLHFVVEPGSSDVVRADLDDAVVELDVLLSHVPESVIHGEIHEEPFRPVKRWRPLYRVYRGTTTDVPVGLGPTDVT